MPLSASCDSVITAATTQPEGHSRPTPACSSTASDEDLPEDAFEDNEDDEELPAAMGQQGRPVRPSKGSHALTGHASLRFYTLCSRLEVYVAEPFWHSLTR